MKTRTATLPRTLGLAAAVAAAVLALAAGAGLYATDAFDCLGLQAYSEGWATKHENAQRSVGAPTVAIPTAATPDGVTGDPPHADLTAPAADTAQAGHSGVSEPPQASGIPEGKWGDVIRRGRKMASMVAGTVLGDPAPPKAIKTYEPMQADR